MLDVSCPRRAFAPRRLLPHLSAGLALGAVAVAQSVLPVDVGDPRQPTTQLFFTVEAKAADVRICGFSVYLRRYLDQPFTVHTVRVYEGPAAASATSPGDWTVVAGPEQTPVLYSEALAYVALDVPIELAAGEAKRVSISAISFDPDAPLQGLRVESPAGAGGVENDDLRVLAGGASASDGEFGGEADAATLLGVVHYTTDVAGGGACGDGTLPVETLPSTLYDGPEPGGVGPLEAGKVYVITPGFAGWSEVPPGKTLTAEPGAILKLGDGTSSASRINVKGTIDFESTTITSLFDDELGGDSDGQLGLIGGNAQPGDYEGLVFESISSGSYDGGLIRYGGSNPVVSTVSVNSANVALDGLLFSDNGGPPATFDGKNKDGVQLRDSFFEGNEGFPITGVTFDSLDGFSGNGAANNLGGNYLQITGSTTGCPGPAVAQVTEDVVVSPSSYPGDVLVLRGSACVTSGASLTFQPGVDVKVRPGDTSTLTVQPGGTLDLIGTAAFPVRFTSLGDDDVAGDTDLDGVNTAQPGDYRGIQYQSGSFGRVQHTEVRYGGDLGPSLALQSGEITADTVVVVRSGNDAVEVRSLNGAFENFYVFGSANDGVVLPAFDPDGSLPDVRNATIVGNGGFGLSTTAGEYGGKIVNTIAWDNANGNYGPGFSAANVRTSLGDFAGENGNLDEDPKLEPKGSILAPAEGSPVVDAGSPVPGLLSDFFAFDRSYSPLSPKVDMGAAERAPSTFTADLFLTGEAVTLAVKSDAATGLPVVYAIGKPAEIYVPGIGLLGMELLGFVTLGVGTVGEDFQFTVPEQVAGGTLVGQSFTTQGVVIEGAKLTPTAYAEGMVVAKTVDQ